MNAVEFVHSYGIAGIFLVSFLAATILPFSSEIFVVAALKTGFDTGELFWAASLGNTLGGASCFYLGRLGKIFWSEKYLKISKEKIYSFKNRVNQFGPVLALLCWLPVIGDPLAVALGYFRCGPMTTMVMMYFGKAGRYAFVLWVASYV